MVSILPKPSQSCAFLVPTSNRTEQNLEDPKIQKVVNTGMSLLSPIAERTIQIDFKKMLGFKCYKKGLRPYLSPGAAQNFSITCKAYVQYECAILGINPSETCFSRYRPYLIKLCPGRFNNHLTHCFFQSVAPYLSPLDLLDFARANKSARYQVFQAPYGGFWRSVASKILPFSFPSKQNPVTSFHAYFTSFYIKYLVISQLLNHPPLTVAEEVDYVTCSPNQEVVYCKKSDVYVNRNLIGRLPFPFLLLNTQGVNVQGVELYYRYLLLEDQLIRLCSFEGQTQIPHMKTNLLIEQFDIREGKLVKSRSIDASGTLPKAISKKNNTEFLITEYMEDLELEGGVAQRVVDVGSMDDRFIDQSTVFALSHPLGKIIIRTESGEWQDKDRSYYFVKDHTLESVKLNNLIKEDPDDHPVVHWTRLVLSPNQELIACPTTKGGVVVWSLKTGEIIKYGCLPFEKREEGLGAIKDADRKLFRECEIEELHFLLRNLLLISVNSCFFLVFDLNDGTWEKISFDFFLSNQFVSTSDGDFLTWEPNADLLQFSYLPEGFGKLTVVEQAKLVLKALKK